MHRRGFTIIELLVTIAVISVLTAILLPAVQAAREAARRIGCVNNLKQLGLAAQGYVDASSVLPPTAFLSGDNPNDFGLKTRLLPFMEQGAAFNALNMSYLSADDENFTVRVTSIATFLCPSDGAAPGVEASLGTVSSTIGGTSYPNNIGTVSTVNRGRFDGPAYKLGQRATGGPVSYPSVTDGLSVTALFSEWVMGRNGTGDGPNMVYTAGIFWPPTASTTLTRIATSCEVSTKQAFDQKGSDYLSGDCGRGGGYSHVMTPDSRACFFKFDGPRADRTLVGASSWHQGGVNVGFMDGSVRFVKDGISDAVWRAIATKAGGEVVGADDY